MGFRSISDSEELKAKNLTWTTCSRNPNVDFSLVLGHDQRQNQNRYRNPHGSNQYNLRWTKYEKMPFIFQKSGQGSPTDGPIWGISHFINTTDPDKDPTKNMFPFFVWKRRNQPDPPVLWRGLNHHIELHNLAFFHPQGCNSQARRKLLFFFSHSSRCSRSGIYSINCTFQELVKFLRQLKVHLNIILWTLLYAFL